MQKLFSPQYIGVLTLSRSFAAPAAPTFNPIGIKVFRGGDQDDDGGAGRARCQVTGIRPH